LKESTLADLTSSEDNSLSRLVSLLADLSTIVQQRIPKELGYSGGVNVYGEKQLEIDVWSNELFTKKLLKSGLVRRVASEEMEEVAESKSGEYSVVLDPLDGSSNLKSNNLLGTIVGVYHDKPLPAKGRDLLTAMYFLYGPFLQLVLALKDGVRLSAAAGTGVGSRRFVSDGQIHKLPRPPTVYGIGGLRDKWTPAVRQFVEGLEKRKLSLRYGGSFVGDYNQVLARGGFFAYPELTDAPQESIGYSSSPTQSASSRRRREAAQALVPETSWTLNPLASSSASRRILVIRIWSKTSRPSTSPRARQHEATCLD